VLKCISKRFRECGLEIHAGKSGIIYCKDKNRRGNYKRISFDFLGFMFRPRRCVNGKGVIHPNFLPAISRTSRKAINQEMRSWHIQLKNDKSLLDLSNMFNPVLKGWNNYYGRFYPSAMRATWKHFNEYLARWVRRKYKRLSWHKRQSFKFLDRLAWENTDYFKHWELGIFPGPKVVGAG